jgi:hypothetical protein
MSTSFATPPFGLSLSKPLRIGLPFDRLRANGICFPFRLSLSKPHAHRCQGTPS